MKILLIGATGQVGTELLSCARDSEKWIATTRSGAAGPSGIRMETLDVTDTDAIDRRIRVEAPDVVINAAAYTAVDRAESERDAAFIVNASAPGAMARACRSVGARLVHYSTDYVFDGSGQRPYREDDPTSPLGVYGHSKLAGEEAVRAELPQHLILRTAWVYATHGHNFLRTMLRLGAERDELRVVDDQVGCPTPAWLIAQTTMELLRRDAFPPGTYNLVCSGQTSWHGFARRIFSVAVERGLLTRSPAVHGIPTSEYPTPARRPAYSVLDTRELRAQGISLPDWETALSRTLES